MLSEPAMTGATEQDAMPALALELAVSSTLPCARHLTCESGAGNGDNTKRTPSRLLTPELSRAAERRRLE